MIGMRKQFVPKMWSEIITAVSSWVLSTCWSKIEVMQAVHTTGRTVIPCAYVSSIGILDELTVCKLSLSVGCLVRLGTDHASEGPKEVDTGRANSIW